MYILELRYKSQMMPSFGIVVLKETNYFYTTLQDYIDKDVDKAT
jgi:hypothetical protein